MYFSVVFSSLGEFSLRTGDPVRIDMFHNKIFNAFTVDLLPKGKSGSPENGREYLGFKALGLVSFKKMAVNVVAPVSVIPGGQSIGILMRSKGVMVVGLSNITDEDGNAINPAEEAGIKVGDVITAINGKTVVNEYQLRNEISTLGVNKEALLEIKRGGQSLKVKVKAVMCRETKRPRIGLYVRDSASGVGTLSFYHPDSRTYGALGHIITDVDTAKSIDLSDGRIVEANIRAIHRGKKGHPGEKLGMIMEDGGISGSIEKNTRYGIYGKIDALSDNPYFSKPVPVAMSYEIKKGPAEIYTVIEGTEITRCTVEIQDVFYPWNSRGKGMVLKVTDRELIRATGGIVQGMSGSPIVQDGKLVGVVTHVFINDPQRGYGVPAEWMLKEMGLLSDKTQQKAS
jgi:stage IV sporulation protein B